MQNTYRQPTPLRPWHITANDPTPSRAGQSRWQSSPFGHAPFGDSQHGLRDIASDVASRSVAFDANDPVAPELEVAADLATTEEAAYPKGQ